mgnify:CR=1 FL=1
MLNQCRYVEVSLDLLIILGTISLLMDEVLIVEWTSPFPSDTITKDTFVQIEKLVD